MAQKENRVLTGGIDSDNAPYAIEQGGLMKAVNVRALRQKGQQAGGVNFIDGNIENSEVTKYLPVDGDSVLLGKCVDEKTRCLYLFINNSVSGNYLIEYNEVTAIGRIVLQDNTLISGTLGWDTDTFICCAVAENKIFWVDGLKDVSYCRLDKIYFTGSIQLELLSLISEPPAVPLTPVRVAVAGNGNQIQLSSVQLMWRFTNEDGFISIFSPYSLTSPPTRDSEKQVDPNAGNTINITASFSQKIPDNWKSVDFAVRYTDSNVFYLINIWDRAIASDLTAVQNHNAGISPLTTAWHGQTIEVVDPVTAAKQFDAIPQISNALTLAANRLMLGNNVEGYDTPLIHPTVTVSQVSTSTVAVSSTTYPMYLLWSSLNGTVYPTDYGGNTGYAILCIQIGADIYALPKDFAQVRYNSATFKRITIPPRHVAFTSLVKLKQTQPFPIQTLAGLQANAGSLTGIQVTFIINLIIDAYKLPLVDGNFDGNQTSIGFYYAQYDSAATTPQPLRNYFIEIQQDPSDKLAGAVENGFLPDTIIGIGIDYYDAALRKCGVQELTTTTTPTLKIGNEGDAKKYITSLSVTMGSGNGSIPDWASYYSIVMSRQSPLVSFLQFIPNIIKIASIDDSGVITVGTDDYINQYSSFAKYGLAIPLDSIAKYNVSTGIKAGDLVTYSFVNELDTINSPGTSLSFTFPVKNILDGYIVTDAPSNLSVFNGLLSTMSDILTLSGGTGTAFFSSSGNTIVLSNQSLCVVTIKSTTIVKPDYFEVAAFGIIDKSGPSPAFGAFFSSGSNIISLRGDSWTQKRTGHTGVFTALSVQRYETVGSILWPGDYGRIATIDRIGQKRLINEFRWSNARIYGASTNGYASFDTADFKTTDVSAGSITALVLTTKNTQDGGQMLVICEHGSFATLVGQQTIKSATGETAFTAIVSVVGDLNSLQGKSGCVSPRSVIEFEGHVWWIDHFNQKVIEFNASGAGVVSQFKAARLWNDILGGVVDPRKITAGVNSYTSEMMVSIPGNGTTIPVLATVPDLENPLDAVSQEVATTFIYNWEANRWVGELKEGNEFLRIGNNVYGWGENKLWNEFVGSPGIYNGRESPALISIPFSANPTVVKSPLALQLTTNVKPDKTWIVAGVNNDSVTSTQSYKEREGEYMAAILRDRFGYGAVNDAGWRANMMKRARQKDKTIVGVFIWQPTNDPINFTLATLVFDVSSGH